LHGKGSALIKNWDTEKITKEEFTFHYNNLTHRNNRQL